MRPPFPPWSDTVFRVALIVGPSALIAALIAPMIYVRTPFTSGASTRSVSQCR
jgi:hypothetical protein